MNRSRRILRFAGFLSLSACFGILLYETSGSRGVGRLLIFALISVLFIYTLSLLLKRLAGLERKEAFRTRLMTGLYTLCDYNSNGLPLLASIEKVAAAVELAELKQDLLLLSRRMKLGERLEDSVNSINSLKEALTLRQDLPVALDIAGISTTLSSYEIELKERLSVIEAACQRYATVNMFISTILPSFIIFSFIGGAIISNSAPSTLLFGTAMLIALPMVYSVSYARLSGRLIG
jgi:hypothetical protein